MKTREKVILYSLPFLLLLLIYLNKEILIINSVSSIDKHVLYSKITTNKENKKLSNATILTFYEQLAKNNKIKINSISFKNKKMLLSSVGKVHNSVAFLYEIEQVNKIEQFHFSYEANRLRIDFFIDTSFVDINKTLENKLTKIKNPYSIQKNEVNKSEQTTAVFDKYIFYKGNWLGIGDKYRNRIIVNITRNFIELRDINGSILKEKIDEE